MAVGSYYQIPGVGVSGGTAGAVLASYMDTIKSMNDAEMAFEADMADTPAAIDKMEISAREKLADMSKALTEAKSGDRRSMNDLIGTVIKAKSSESETSARVAGSLAEKKLGMYQAAREDVSREAESAGKRIAVKPETARVISGFGATVRNNASSDAAALAAAAANTFAGQVQGESAGTPADAKFSKMAVDAYESLASEGEKGKAVAAEFLKRVQPQMYEALQNGQPPGDYFMEVHAPNTWAKVRKEVEDVERKFGAGVRSGTDEVLRGAGISYADLGGGGSGESASTATRGGGDDDGPRRAGGSFSVSGLSPEAAMALSQGDDPYAALQAAIAAQAKHIADLNERRASATASRPSLYPRPNVYTVSPNRVVPTVPRGKPAPVGDAAFQKEMEDWRNEPRTSRIDTLDITGDPLERDWRDQNPGYRRPAPEAVEAVEAEPEWAADFDVILTETPAPSKKKDKAPEWAAEFDAILE